MVGGLVVQILYIWHEELYRIFITWITKSKDHAVSKMFMREQVMGWAAKLVKLDQAILKQITARSIQIYQLLLQNRFCS
jgi:hypothetical protein